MKKTLTEEKVGLLLILPNYIIYLVFVLIPVFYVVYLGFTNYDLINKPKFTGMENYMKLAGDEVFRAGILNTFIYSLFTIIPGMALGLVIAVILNNKSIKGIPAIRACYFIPNIVSMVAAAMVWLWIYDPAQGLLNSVITKIGFARQDWLFDMYLALPSIIIVGLWMGLGYNMIIYLAGLQGIPEDLYEAATIDGATRVRQFFHITLPMLQPTTFFLFVMACIKSFQVFDQVYIMTNGGPANATTTIVHRLYENAFQFYKMGYGSSMAVFLLVITTFVTVINFKYGNQGTDTSL